MYFWHPDCKTVIDKQQDVKFTSVGASHIHESKSSDGFEVPDFDPTDSFCCSLRDHFDNKNDTNQKKQQH